MSGDESMSPEGRQQGAGGWADRLEAERAVPDAAFAAELRADLVEQRAERASVVTRRDPRVLIGIYGVVGLMLLALVALGALGVGPLAAG